MPADTNPDHVRSRRCAGFSWMWLVTTIAIAATVIAFRRFASNERVAHAIAVGVINRRGESATSEPLPFESRTK